MIYQSVLVIIYKIKITEEICGPLIIRNSFDRLFDRDYDIAIYAHTHHQLLRYSSNDQLIINPGTVGQPFYKWNKLNSDLRAQYAILEIDEAGITDVRFKKVFTM